MSYVLFRRRLMQAYFLLLALTLALTNVVAGTNTPFPPGTMVSVTSAAGTVTGALHDVTVTDWIGVKEFGQAGIPYIRGADVIVRPLNAASFSANPLSPLFAPASATTATFIPQEGGPPTGAESPAEHYVFGRPRVVKDRFSFTPAGLSQPVFGITYHVREAFTIGHFNRMKTPAWVAIRWTRQDLVRSEAVDLDGPPFVRDTELPLYAQSGRDLDYNTTQMERGHMARNADLEGWGTDAVAEGMRMRNICPQRNGRNHVVWGKLENQHRFIVQNPQQSGIDTVWIISGPVFYDDDEDGTIEENELDRIGEDDVAAPDATYKVIAWEDNNGFNIRAYLIEKDDTNTDLRNYLITVDEIENLTGLDFFSNLNDTTEASLESQVHTSLRS